MDRLKYIEKIEPEKSNLIKALQKVQEQEGYISDNSVEEISEYFSIPPVEVEGVVTFYSQFKRSELGEHVISLCNGTACHIKGAMDIYDALQDELGLDEGEITTSDKLFTLETVSCLGACGLAPVMMINEDVHGKLTTDKAREIIRELRLKEKGNNG